MRKLTLKHPRLALVARRDPVGNPYQGSCNFLGFIIKKGGL